MLGVKKKIQANEGQFFPLTTPAIAPLGKGPVPGLGSEKNRAP
jgi:hypothetical protein